MTTKTEHRVLRRPVMLLSMALMLSSGITSADEVPSIDALEHKEKSTIETFHLKAIDSDELSATVIAGGLEPTSAGGNQRNQPVTVYEDVSTVIDTRDRQTDIGRYEIPARVNYAEPKSIEGMRFGHSYSIRPDPGNRTYNNSYQVNASER